MGIQIKRMNWYQKKPLYQVNQAWRQKRQAMISDFQNASASASAAFTGAQINRSAGMAALAAQASVARSQSEIQATIDSLTALKVDLLA